MIAHRKRAMHLTRKIGVLLLGWSALCAASPASLHAQAINHDELEQVFGEPVTTSVTGKPQRASEVPGNLTIITQDDIRRSGATSIADVLQFVPGVDIRHNWLGDTQVAIRGYARPMTPRLLVLINGRQVYLDDYGNVAWNALPVQMNEIRQIEVVKGPNTALFGYNAAAGVVNIVTFDPLFDTVNKATIGGGTQGFGEANVVTTAHFGGTAGVRISAGGWTANEFHTAPANSGYRYPRAASLNLDGRWQVSSDVLLRAEASMVDALTPRVTPLTFSTNNRIQSDSLRLGAAAATGLGLIDADIYRNAGIYEYTLPFANSNSPRNIVTVARLGDILKLNAAHTIRVSLDYRHNSLHSQDIVGGTVSYDNTAASAMWDWQVTPSLSVNNAARFDHLALHYSGNLLAINGRTLQGYNATRIDATSFNSGLVYKVTSHDTLRLTLGKGLELPSLLDFGIQVPVGGFTILGSTSLVPTEVWNADLGLDHEVDAIRGILRASVFAQRNLKLLGSPGATTPSLSGDTIYSQAANTGSSDEVGFELGLHGCSDAGLRWNASYRFAAISDNIPSANFALFGSSARYRNGTPQHTFILGSGATLGRFEVDGQVRWQSAFTDYHLGATGTLPFVVTNNVTLNGRVGYTLTENITLAAVLQRYTVSQLLQQNFGSRPQVRGIASATAHF